MQTQQVHCQGLPFANWTQFMDIKMLKTTLLKAYKYETIKQILRMKRLLENPIDSKPQTKFSKETSP